MVFAPGKVAPNHEPAERWDYANDQFAAESPEM
jgi:hypothetical protein